MCKIQIPEGATLDEKRTLCFDALYNMKLGEMVEKKDNLSYLSWSNAWKAFKEVYPSATFRVICNPDTKLPYFVDPNVGIMVFTEVTADNAADQKKTTVRRAKTIPAPTPQPTQPVDRFAPIKNAINSATSTDALLDLYLQHQNEVEGNPSIKQLFTERKLQLKQAA